MRKALLAGALAIMTAAPAYAAPVISFTNGVFSLPPGAGAIFQNFESSPGGGVQYTPAPGEVTTGEVRVFTNTVPGTTVDPDSNPNNKYLSIENGSYSILFGTPTSVLSFIIGTVDAYNQLTLTLADSTVLNYSGRQILGDTVIGPLNSNTSGRVTYNFGSGPALVSATFSSSQAALELDDVASVPEPMTWAMLIGGFGLIGTQLRSRRRKYQTAAA